MKEVLNSERESKLKHKTNTKQNEMKHKLDNYKKDIESYKNSGHNLQIHKKSKTLKKHKKKKHHSKKKGRSRKKDRSKRKK